MNAHLFSRSSKILLGILFVLCLAPLIATARPLENSAAKIEPAVLEQFAAQNEITYWAILREKADLRPAYAMHNWEARGRFVYERLRAVALSSQAKLRAQLQSKGVAHQPYWIINAIKVTSDKATLHDLAAQPEVEQIVADGAYQISEPLPGQPEPGVQTVEWNIDRINAPQVWSTFGDRGEGIVIANIDSGVQFDHPALVNQYRGNQGGGNFDHNYNWYDPSNVCGYPSLVPCDNVGHGSHTMGTMVGDDGDQNQIGVAPGARWIAAKGCEYSSCSFSALMAAGQWVLAPTDLNGQNPRADLRPHIVNNSWGGGGNDAFYQATVDAWIASGIFPAFSNGNSGMYGCYTSGSPGDYVQSYSAGAFDSGNNIAYFSSRGPSYFGGEIKPNIAAPGVNVRSSVPYNSYDTYSGTSMASPHVAGTVALMWSAAPSIIGEITETRALLDQTAIDTSDLSCGGSDADNNVWGEGRLDAYAAVELAPRGPAGALQGTVVTTDPFLSPLPGATVQVVGPTNRMTLTDAAGQYAFPFLPVGTYDMLVNLFGYLTGTATGVTVSEGATTVQDFTLTRAPSYMISGYVRDNNGAPVANATVTILDTPIPPATTDENGYYNFASVPRGEYEARAAAGGCNDPQTLHLSVGEADVTLDFTLPQRIDAYGYFCQHTTFDYIEATNRLPLYGWWSTTQVDLPFPFTFYGQTYDKAFVSTSGFLNFLGWDAYPYNSPIPNMGSPNAAIYPFWDEVYVDYYDSSVNTELLGTAPDRKFVIEWRNVHFCCVSAETFDFEVVLYENGRILTQYRNIDANGREQGNSATLGIENETGTVALQYSYNEPVISNHLAVLYRLPPSGFVEGRVSDANDGLPVAATVRALKDGSQIRAVTTNADGFYRMQVPVGTYTVEAAAPNYTTGSAQVVVGEDQLVTQNFALNTARAEVNPTTLAFIVPVKQSRTKILNLSNTGSADLVWEIREARGTTVLTRQGNGTWLYKSSTGVSMSTNTGSTALAYPSAYRWQPAQPSASLNILIYADDPFHPAPSTYLDQALQNLALPYTAHYNGDFYGFESDLASRLWDIVLFGNDNYIPPGSTLTALNNYVTGGGKLILNGWTVGRNPGHPLWRTLGFTWVSDDNEPPDPVHWWQPYHPIFTDPENVPEPTSLTGYRYGVYGQRVEPQAGFEALAGYTTPGPDPKQAAMIVGNNDRTVFKGFLDGQNDADRDGDAMRDGIELWINLITGIQTGFFTDVPWLSENPISGIVTPGKVLPIQVKVDTTGLAPGVYHASLTFRTNSARQPTLRVPVSLLVPAYQQGVNAGGKSYIDRAGDSWAADKLYAANSWGYVNKSTTLSVKKGISRTDDDPLYQDLRSGVLEYRFDGLPAGIYQVELRFAELKPTQPGLHMFDVLIEGNMMLYKHDIALEVGNLAADDHTYFLPVTDGQLNVRLIPYRGYGDTIINALRVTQRPDR